MTEERAQARESSDASVIRGSGSGIGEHADAHGRYEIECFGPDGKLKWRETIENVVQTVGKNLALDTFLAGSAYTVTGPYMGLISSTSYSAVAAGDTMTSHAGWLEAGGTNAPTYSGNRKTAVWSAAASGSKRIGKGPTTARNGRMFQPGLARQIAPRHTRMRFLELLEVAQLQDADAFVNCGGDRHGHGAIVTKSPSQILNALDNTDAGRTRTQINYWMGALMEILYLPIVGIVRWWRKFG
jgi:hypothetical protein